MLERRGFFAQEGAIACVRGVEEDRRAELFFLSAGILYVFTQVRCPVEMSFSCVGSIVSGCEPSQEKGARAVNGAVF